MKIGVDIGVTTGPVTLDTMVARARRARELGLHSVWMGQFVRARCLLAHHHLLGSWRVNGL